MRGRGFIAPERPQQCDLCGAIAELRPYGPNGECVCFECGMKDVRAASKRMAQYILRMTEEEAKTHGGDDDGDE